MTNYEKNIKKNNIEINELNTLLNLFKSEKEIYDLTDKKFINKDFIINLRIKNFYNVTKKLIDNISLTEKYKENSFLKIEDFIKEESKIKRLVKHLNIILVGKTGVGKTTLINAFLNYKEEECLEIGFGNPCTFGEPEYHMSKNNPLIRLADTRGIELNSYGVEQLSESIESFITTKIKEGNPDDFVHCIWYCVTGTRLEKIQIDTLKKLSEIYKSKSIPVIIVYTQALSDEKIKLMHDFVDKNINFEYNFVPVLAQKEIVRKTEILPFGFDVLRNISFVKAKEAVITSFIEKYTFQSRKLIEIILKEIKEKSNSFLNIKLKNKLNIMKNEKSNEEISDDLKNLLFNLISNNIYVGQNRFLSNESEQLIFEFSKDFISKSFSDFKNIFEKIIPDIHEELFSYASFKKLLKNEEKRINQNNIKLFVENKKEHFFERIWLLYIKNQLKKICTLCADLLNKNSEEIFNNIINEKEFKICIEKIVIENFEEIKEKLQLN